MVSCKKSDEPVTTTTADVAFAKQALTEGFEDDIFELAANIKSRGDAVSPRL